MSQMLDDARIRPALIDFLANSRVPPKAILEELGVHNGNAIADVVTIHSEAHCYEIKGESDSVRRIISQAKHYDLAFRKITLVTTENHLRKALEISPAYWGIIVASGQTDRITFRHIRKASINSNFDKQKAALTLWKEEMLKILPSDRKLQRRPRDFLAQLISETHKKVEISKNISNALVERQFSH